MDWSRCGRPLVVGVAVVVLVGVVTGVSVGLLAGVDEGPLAEAGLDQTIVENTTVYLDAGGSTVPNGSIDSYEWTITAPDGTTVTPECPRCVQTAFVPTQVGRYAVTVTVTDDDGRTDEDTLYVTVEPYERPDATLSGPGTVSVGSAATFTLTADAGDEPLQRATWRVNGTRRATTTLADAGDTVEQNLTFTEPGVREVEVVVSDALGYETRVERTIRVKADGPYLTVDIENTTAPVEEGQPLTVEATVTNVGDTFISGSVWLTRGDATVDLVTGLVLRSNHSATVTLTWQTNPGDAGTHTLAVQTVNDTDATPAAVTSGPGVGQPYFDVEFDTPPPDTVTPGTTVQPTVLVSNTGDAPGTQTIVLTDIRGQPVASANLTLGAGESRTLTDLSWTPTTADTGVGNLTAASADDTANASLRVAAPANFAVEIAWTRPTLANLSANDGDAVIAINVTNTGDLDDTQTIDLDGFNPGSGTTVDIEEREIALNGSESIEYVAEWENVQGSLGCGTAVTCDLAFTNVTAASEDDSDRARLFDGADGNTSVIEVPFSGNLRLSVASDMEPGEKYAVNLYVVNEKSGDVYNNIDPNAHSIITSVPGAFFSPPLGKIRVNSDTPGGTGVICAILQSTEGEETLPEYPEGDRDEAPVANPGSLTCQSITVEEGEDDDGPPV